MRRYCRTIPPWRDLEQPRAGTGATSGFTPIFCTLRNALSLIRGNRTHARAASSARGAQLALLCARFRRLPSRVPSSLTISRSLSSMPPVRCIGTPLRLAYKRRKWASSSSDFAVFVGDGRSGSRRVAHDHTHLRARDNPYQLPNHISPSGARARVPLPQSHRW